MGDSQDVTFRAYREGDLPHMVAVTAAVFGSASIDARIETRIGCDASWTELKADALRREVTENPEGCFVAERDGQFLGYVTTTIMAKASRGVIANLAVSADAQGLGLGGRLIERALDHFRQRGLKQAKIETLSTNEAGNHLYPKMGFQEIVRQVHFVMPL